MQVLQRHWDRTFSNHRDGFRPGRSVHQAVAQQYIAEGHGRVLSYGPSTVSPRKFAAVFFRNSICQSAADADCTPPAIRPDPFAAAGGVAGPAGGRRHYADQVSLFRLFRERRSIDDDATRRPAAYFQRARLKYWTSRSCFSAAARVLNVPRFLRFPVLRSFFFEYNRYSPLCNFRII